MRKVIIRPGYERAEIQIIVDIKMDGNFIRRSILVAYRQTNAPP